MKKKSNTRFIDSHKSFDIDNVKSFRQRPCAHGCIPMCVWNVTHLQCCAIRISTMPIPRCSWKFSKKSWFVILVFFIIFFFFMSMQFSRRRNVNLSINSFGYTFLRAWKLLKCLRNVTNPSCIITQMHFLHYTNAHVAYKIHVLWIIEITNE